jgi:hypothetical protein
MTISKKLFNSAQLGTGVATYYTAGALTTTIIKKLTFTNTTAIAVSVTVYLIVAAGTAGDANTLRKTKTVAPNDVFECFEAEGHMLAPGDFIQALCSAAASITIMGSGIELTQ